MGYMHINNLYKYQDIVREGAGEVVMSPAAEKAIGKRTVQLLKHKVQTLVVTL